MPQDLPASGIMSTMRAPCSSRSRRRRLPAARVAATAAVGSLGLTAGAAPAQALVPPTSPPDVSVRTSGGWTVALHGPDGPADAQLVETEVSLTNPEGVLEYVLYPEIDLADQGCRATGRRNCVPARANDRPLLLVGSKGLVVKDNGRVLPPTVVVQMKRAGQRCCGLLSGYVPDGEGAYDNTTVNGGSARLITKGGLTLYRIGDPVWERLDWPASAYPQNYRWMSLNPVEGWTEATSEADHLKELRRLERLRSRGTRTARASAAISLSHLARMGRTKNLDRAAKAYRRAYGAKSFTRVARALALEAGAATERSVARSAPTGMRPAAEHGRR